MIKLEEQIRFERTSYCRSLNSDSAYNRTLLEVGEGKHGHVPSKGKDPAWHMTPLTSAKPLNGNAN